MKVNELLAEMPELEALSICDGERDITGAYAGDLLSWVMGRVQSGDVWATIMTNINIVAVASLCDAACVVICEGAEVANEVIDTARTKDVNVLRTSMKMFEFCVALNKTIG